MAIIKTKKQTVGWREWVKLPDLDIDFIKAKVDTGATTSCLHAFDLETFRSRSGKEMVRFTVHPQQRKTGLTVRAEAKVKEYRNIRSSSGHLSQRPVIETTLEILGQTWLIELTLANRDEMGFRMLLGRESLRGRLIVDPGKSYYSDSPKRKKKKKTKTKTKTITKKTQKKLVKSKL